VKSRPSRCRHRCKRPESATHAFGVRKGGVEHWNAINATICEPSVCKLRINATQREGFVGRFYTQLPHLAGQPFGGRVVDCRSGSMVALGIEGMKQARNALLKSTG